MTGPAGAVVAGATGAEAVGVEATAVGVEVFTDVGGGVTAEAASIGGED